MNDSHNLLRATLKAFDEAIAANPDNADLKARRAELEKISADSSKPKARLAEVEAAMHERVTDPELAKYLLRQRDRLAGELEKP